MQNYLRAYKTPNIHIFRQFYIHVLKSRTVKTSEESTDLIEYGNEFHNFGAELKKEPS